MSRLLTDVADLAGYTEPGTRYAEIRRNSCPCRPVTLRFPVVLHCRERDPDLQRWALRVPCEELKEGVPKEHSQHTLILHSNLYFGIGPRALTANRSTHPNFLRAVPLERVQVETDAPYLAPDPARATGVVRGLAGAK